MTISTKYQNQLEEDRFGLRVTARLSDTYETLPYDISERLRAARAQALGKRRIVARTSVEVVNSGGVATLTFDNESPNWWTKIASAMPLLVLAVGMIAINLAMDDKQVREIADIDIALLTDDLPPTAYADPGFVQFLKLSSAQYK
jgi:hypothetical protein